MKTSEKIILTIVVIFFIPINILAQKTNIVVNKVKTSEIYIDTDVSEYGNINCINFPTCSKNKKIVMLVHNDFSCCTQTSTELYLIDVNHNLIENKIQNYSRKFKLDFWPASPATLESAKNNGSHYLVRGIIKIN